MHVTGRLICLCPRNLIKRIFPAIILHWCQLFQWSSQTPFVPNSRIQTVGRETSKQKWQRAALVWWIRTCPNQRRMKYIFQRPMPFIGAKCWNQVQLLDFFISLVLTLAYLHSGDGLWITIRHCRLYSVLNEKFNDINIMRVLVLGWSKNLHTRLSPWPGLSLIRAGTPLGGGRGQ